MKSGKENGRAILAGRQADSARAAACEIAARMNDMDTLTLAARLAPQQSIVPAAVQWRPHSIARGSAGLAVFFSYLDGCFPNQGWDDAARRHLDVAVRSIESQDTHTGSLFDGLSGVAFAAWHLSHNGNRYCKLSTTLDEAICPLAEDLSAQIKAARAGLTFQCYDVVSGAAGLGAYLLCRRKLARAREALQSVLCGLVKLSGEPDGVPRWKTPANLVADQTVARAHPGGILNCGLAHGIPGPLALLSLARICKVEVEGQAAAIERLSDWLLRNRADDAWGVNWPAVVPLSRLASQMAADCIDRPVPARTAWCYGSPGVARALWLAGKAINRPSCCDVAVEAMQAAVTKPVEARDIPSPTFCHGVAGLLQITLRFAVDTGLLVFREAVSKLTAELIEAHEPGSLLGYRSIDGGGRRLDDPGFLDGAAGVALTLLAASCPLEPTWDRLFLLS
jgi:lantibiotic modifying enzyme